MGYVQIPLPLPGWARGTWALMTWVDNEPCSQSPPHSWATGFGADDLGGHQA